MVMMSWWPFSSRRASSSSDSASFSEEAPLTATGFAGSDDPVPFGVGDNEATAAPLAPGLGSARDDEACADPELAISPKSIQMLEEVEMRVFLRTRRRKMLTGAILVVALLAATVTAILYPREANFNLQSFDIDEENPTYKDGDQLMTNWVSQVAVDNRNFYPIDIREIKVTAYLERDRRAPIGKGNGANLYFPARSTGVNSVRFQMPVYAPSSGMPSLIAECMTHDKVDLFLSAELDLAWTHWSGKWIPMEFFATVDCKVPAIAQLVTQSMARLN